MGPAGLLPMKVFPFTLNFSFPRSGSTHVGSIVVSCAISRLLASVIVTLDVDAAK